MVTPEFVGTLPQWIAAVSSTTLAGAVVALVTAYWKRGISLKGLENADEADRRDHMAEEMGALRENVANLRQELHDCEANCASEIKQLQNELLGEKRQRVAEQISLINIIVDIVDEPTRKRLMAALDSIQRIRPMTDDGSG